MIKNKASMAILAKSRAMYGRRLSPGDYNELIHKRSVAEAAAYLKHETSYGGALSGIEENIIHRGQLEVLIKKSHADKYLRLSSFLPFEKDAFFHCADKKNELDTVLSAVHYFNIGEMERFFELIPGFVLERMKFDVAALSKSARTEDFIAAVKNTVYAGILEKNIDKTRDKFILERCENQIYTAYYNYMLKQAKKGRSKALRRDLENILGKQIEQLNIRLVYRLRHYFGLPPEEIRQRLVLNKRGSAADKMLALKDEAGMLDLAYPGMNKSASAETYYNIEHFSQSQMKTFYQKLLRMSNEPLTVFLAYSELNNIEVQNLISIIEGIRYGVGEKALENLLAL
ncbi:MAG: V-type ATPase subunit [Oscillospiraceae bacterium]|jgi:V/A-type H+-transporting ATPase subunit C|nr:V-type ATPase subunit [Oscillospiraceae bacterium]